jgi:hypothetical protein
MSGKTDGVKIQLNSPLNHFLQRIPAIAIGTVGVQILQIFHLFVTLLKSMWTYIFIVFHLDRDVNRFFA